MPEIISVSSEVVSFPVDPPVLRPTGGGIRYIDNVIIHVDTDEGIRGSSYVWTHSAREARLPAAGSIVFVIQAAVAPLADIVVGRDVREYEKMRADVGLVESTIGGGVLTTAYSGLDMAVWDAMCKSLGAPLYQLLGRRHDSLPTYCNELLHVWNDDSAELAAAAEVLLARGFSTLKMPLSAFSDDMAVERVRVVREAAGPSVGLAVDLGSTFTFGSALRLSRRLEEFGLAWIEDPIPIDRVDEYARLCAELETPVAAGETSYSMQLFRRLLEQRALDMVIFEPMRVGGITGALKLGALTETFGVPIAPHVYHNVGAHLLSAFSNAAVLEYLPWWDVLLEEPVTPNSGMASAIDRPGIGLEFNPEALAEYSVTPAPHVQS
jgi:L-alanine-DL-glutamate epimerase-like enolase superfamily enzyme